MLRDGQEGLGRRDGNVEEEADRVLDAATTQCFGQRNEMIVVNPDRVVGLKQRLELARKPLVDVDIALIETGIELRQIEAVVEDRPDDRVRIAEVIFVVFLLAQTQRGHLAGCGTAYGLLLRFLRSWIWLLDPAAPTEPEAVPFAQDVGQYYGDAASLCSLAQIDDAVGHKYDARQGLPPRNSKPSRLPN